MKTRWIFQSWISNTSHQRPAPDSGSPARHGPSWCSPWLVPSATMVSLPEKIQLKWEKWWVIALQRRADVAEQLADVLLAVGEAPLREIDLRVVGEQIEDRCRHPR